MNTHQKDFAFPNVRPSSCRWLIGKRNYRALKVGMARKRRKVVTGLQAILQMEEALRPMPEGFDV